MARRALLAVLALTFSFGAGDGFAQSKPSSPPSGNVPSQLTDAAVAIAQARMLTELLDCSAFNALMAVCSSSDSGKQKFSTRSMRLSQMLEVVWKQANGKDVDMKKRVAGYAEHIFKSVDNECTNLPTLKSVKEQKYCEEASSDPGAYAQKILDESVKSVVEQLRKK